MKTIKYIFLTLICFTLLLASETTANVTTTTNPTYPDPTPFLGTWQYQNGNQLFTVYLWEDFDQILGSYKMQEYNNGVVGNTIYSAKEAEGGAFEHQGQMYVIPSIMGDLYTESLVPYFSGAFRDSTTEGHPYIKNGHLEMHINYNGYSSSCNMCPFTLTWKVTINKGIQAAPVYDFSVPTDIILTKVSSNIDGLFND